MKFFLPRHLRDELLLLPLLQTAIRKAGTSIKTENSETRQMLYYYRKRMKNRMRNIFRLLDLHLHNHNSLCKAYIKGIINFVLRTFQPASA